MLYALLLNALLLASPVDPVLLVAEREYAEVTEQFEQVEVALEQLDLFEGILEVPEDDPNARDPDY
jgi:hypothetical protein